MIRLRSIAAIFLFGATILAPTRGFAHGSTMLLAADGDRSGQLIIDPTFEFEEIYPLEAGVSIGGFTLYTTIVPSFAWLISPEPVGSPVAYPLKANTQVKFELISISANTAVRINGTRMTTPGQTAVIGDVSTDPEAHVHPEWQVTLPEGTIGDFQVGFRLTTTTRSYTTSPVYQINLTNRSATPTASPTSTLEAPATATPTSPLAPTASPTSALPSPSPTATAVPPTPTSVPPTASPSATATATTAPTEPPACEGDCASDGEVTVDDVVKLIQIALGNVALTACEPGDSNGDQQVTVEEIVRAVNNALAGCPASA